MLCFGYGLVARLSWLFLVALGRFPVVFALALSIGRCGAFFEKRFYRFGRRYAFQCLWFFASRVHRVSRRYSSMYTKIDVYIAWRCVVRCLVLTCKVQVQVPTE